LMVTDFRQEGTMQMFGVDNGIKDMSASNDTF